MRVLITGVTGFVGGYLASHLGQDPQLELYAIVRDSKRLLPSLHKRVVIFAGDLCNAEFVAQTLKKIQPNQLYHLAGQSAEPQAWSDPWSTFQTNVQGQLNLLSGMIDQGLKPRFLTVTSSKVYGAVPSSQMPINEATPLRPDSPYGVSKAAQDLMAQQYHLSHHLPVIRVRAFNHIGPRQNKAFVTAAFAHQIASIEAGLREPIMKVGNLAVKRDFTDVEDVVRAYQGLMSQGKPGQVYNVSSGKAVAVQELLDILLNLSEVNIEIKPDAARMRPSEQPISYGDITKIRQEINWEPTISIEDSLARILDYWRLLVTN